MTSPPTWPKRREVAPRVADLALTRSERLSRRRKARRRRATIVLAAVSAVGLGAGTYGYAQLNGNITRLDIADALGTARPTPKATSTDGGQPLNILLIGSDQRVGLDSTKFGKDTIEGGPHSDTNLLVHVSGDRSWAMVTSIPRDSMVPSPADCTDPNSPVSDEVIRQWNQNFNKGGPACVIRTLEANTGVFVNHFAVVNFDGFRDMVDALGGVDVCLSQDVVDRDSQFELSAGRHHVDGATALGYVRVRKSIGDGSDLSRIKRQQAFLSSVVQQATNSSMVLRPDRMYSFLNAATKSLTTDTEFSTGEMRSMATAVAGIGLSNINFYTVPTRTYAPDPNRVEWTEQAQQLWDAMRNDHKPGQAPKPGQSATPTPTPTSTGDPGLTASPDEISVQLVNDSGTAGVAKQAGEALLAQGFGEVTWVSGESDSGGAVIHHSEANEDAARTVAAAFPGARLQVDESAGDQIVVHLGSAAPAVVDVPNRIGDTPLPSTSVTPTPSTPSDVVTGRSASTDICT